jgi:hypothetical protein
VREQLVRDDWDGVGREPVPDAIEPDETSVCDLGGERLAVADREERSALFIPAARFARNGCTFCGSVSGQPGDDRSERISGVRADDDI